MSSLHLSLLSAEGKFRVSRYAPWRRRAPSERQLQLLKILKGVKAGGEGTEEVRIMGKTVAINDLTAGELSSYL